MIAVYAAAGLSIYLLFPIWTGLVENANLFKNCTDENHVLAATKRNECFKSERIKRGKSYRIFQSFVQTVLSSFFEFPTLATRRYRRHFFKT